MKVILDTNIFLISLPGKSIYHPIFQSLINNLYHIAVSTEILLEYDEIISLKANSFVAKNTMELLNVLPNVIHTDVFYKWNLILEDSDDNKFVDCALASNSDYLVTNDRHFNVLASIDFPKLNVITADEFLIILKNL